MVAKIVSYVSLGYLLLFKSSGYCCYGNLLKWHANCTFFIIVTLFETFFFGGGEEGEGKMALPMPYIINCDMILSSHI